VSGGAQGRSGPRSGAPTSKSYNPLDLLYVLGGFDTKAALAGYADNCCIAYDTTAFGVHYWGVNVSEGLFMFGAKVD